MNILFNDSNERYTSFVYNSEDNIFILKGNEGNEIEYYPELELDDEYNYHEYELLFLNNERDECTENSIYQVFVDEKRIGWVFPLQALLSCEHDKATNSHFIKYAYVAISNLLNQIHISTDRSSSDVFKLNDYYETNINLLVLCKEKCNEIECFDINDYTVSLYDKGYSFSGKGNLNYEVSELNERVNLKKVSEEIHERGYINKLFKESVSLTTEPFAKFHIYYQIVELLISSILKYEFKKYIDDINIEKDDLFDRRDELGTLINEKTRIKRLLTYSSGVDEYTKSNLNEFCCDLLKKHNEKYVDNDVMDNLYKVRCLLVHRLYVLNDDDDEVLDSINKFFLKLIISVLFSFKVPN